MNLLSVLFVVLFVAAVVLWIMQIMKTNTIRKKYEPIVDVEKEVEKKKAEISEREKEFANLQSEYETKEKDLRAEYASKRAIFDKLTHEYNILEEKLEYMSFGIYEPHYDFDTSEKYKAKLEQVRGKQKELVKEKAAAVCSTEWQVGGSKAEGRKMTNRNIKLMLRAFNNECDAAVLKIRWNNAPQMEARIQKAFDAINELGAPNQIEITKDYLKLKLKELHLTHEYQMKLQEEKEEQRRIKEEMREEEKARREMEKAQQDAEKEEQRYEDALARARREIETAQGDKLERLREQMAQLEHELKEAQEKKERALSMAQQTKSGHVYVISNIGSFGENVYKIGMTRRLDPMDRVKELGDASVPFNFDVHAMIYSDDAPKLESTLHQELDEKRLNLVNLRREFFRVPLKEIKSVATKVHGEFEMTMLAEAQEYYESVSIRKKKTEEPEPEPVLADLPDEI